MSQSFSPSRSPLKMSSLLTLTLSLCAIITLGVVELVVLGARLRCLEIDILRVFKVVKSPSIKVLEMTWV